MGIDHIEVDPAMLSNVTIIRLRLTFFAHLENRYYIFIVPALWIPCQLIQYFAWQRVALRMKKSIDRNAVRKKILHSQYPWRHCF